MTYITLVDCDEDFTGFDTSPKRVHAIHGHVYTKAGLSAGLLGHALAKLIRRVTCFVADLGKRTL